MGRRSSHTAAELQALIITSARRIVETDGFDHLSARTIAQVIGYSPGTLYNVFRSLDELMLHVEAGLLDEFDAELEATLCQAPNDGALAAVASAHIDFAIKNANMWNMILVHQLPQAFPVPDWYQARLNACIWRIQEAYCTSTSAAPSEATHATAVMLWASFNGLSALVTASKLAGTAPTDVRSMAIDLANRFGPNRTAPKSLLQEALSH